MIGERLHAPTPEMSYLSNGLLSTVLDDGLALCQAAVVSDTVTSTTSIGTVCCERRGAERTPDMICLSNGLLWTVLDDRFALCQIAAVSETCAGQPQ